MRNPKYQCKCNNLNCKNPADVIHHKDKNRKNNTKDNLVYLCTSCHRKEHIDYTNEDSVLFRANDTVDYFQPHKVGYRLKAGFNMLNEDYS